MRIFVASGIFHPESGGPATYLHRLIPELLARGHEVRVLTFGNPAAGDYPYPVQRIPRRALPLRTAAYVRAALPEVRRADLLFLNSLGLPLITRQHKPTVLKVVGDVAWERAVRKRWIAPDADIDRFQREHYDWRIRLNRAAQAREVQRMDQIIVPSRYLYNMVTGWGAPPEQVQLIYNALEAHPTLSTLSPAEARSTLHLDTGPLLLTVARLVAWKGIDHLIRALVFLPDVRLLVAGDGPEELRLRALAESENVAPRVTFLGRVPRERLAIYLRAVDYTVLYSGYEGLPHVLLESLLAGTPVIASDKGGNPEVVRHNENGLLVPYVDREALISTLRTSFSGDMRARLAAHSAEGLERFRWETLVDSTIALLEEVCTS
jgi:glycosyltransferase involved in cell wall biosynthesis